MSAPGKFIAFSLWSAKDQANIWRMDMDGGNLRQLTNRNQDFPPALSPDGKWIVFATMQGDKNVLMKIPSEGGQPSQLTDYASDHPSISPDGKWIACFYTVGQNQPESLALVPFAGGPPARVFSLPVTANIYARLIWTPDSRAVSFLNDADGVSNVWEQPIAGGQPRPVTHFTSDKIFYFDWSRDGRLALSRGTNPIDAVLIRGFR